MRFEHPNLLWLLLVIPPALMAFFWWAMRARQSLLAQFIEARLLSALTVGISPARKKIRFGCLILAVALLLVALARPQHGFDLQEVEQRGLDIVVAVDTSKSMLATDIAPDRLERAKLAALELMQTAGTDRLGLVAFAGDAFLECPLTIDNTAFQQCVQALDVNSLPEGGTDIAAAIKTALTAFKEGDRYKVLVLLTDGEDNVNDAAALEAARDAAKAGLTIFTIGIGTAEGALLNPNLVRDPEGNAVKSHLNEALLQQMAGAAGGFYLPLRGANTMDVLYERGLVPLPKSEGRERLIKRYHEQYHWPLAAAILLLLAELFLPERRVPTRREPDGGLKRAVPEAGVPMAILVALLGLAVCGNASASPASALHDYRTGNFTNALQEFSRMAGVQTNDLRLVFNAGDAAYRATNFDLAQKFFQQATVSPDLKLQQQAFYNLGNTRYRLGELKADDLNSLAETWTNAAQSYAHAVKLNTNDVDAAFNLAFVNENLVNIKKLREILQNAKQEADKAVQQAEFQQALEIMRKLPPRAKKLSPEQIKDFTKKLKDINDIETQNPDQP